MARAARTYGVKALFIVTPLEDQQRLVKTLIAHWTDGAGAAYNPKRREAFESVSIQNSLETAIEEIASKENGHPQTIVTSAKEHSGAVSITRFRDMLLKGDPYLMIFGTAWGLDESYMETADHVLEPIRGCTEYNHLSVRSATSIILDRLLGRM